MPSEWGDWREGNRGIMWLCESILRQFNAFFISEAITTTQNSEKSRKGKGKEVDCCGLHVQRGTVSLPSLN